MTSPPIRTDEPTSLRALIAACMAASLATCLLDAPAQRAFAAGNADVAQADVVKIAADNKQVNANGDVEASGDVQINYGQREITTPAVRYRAHDKNLAVPGEVDFVDPQVHIKGAGASIDVQRDAEVNHAQFELPARDGHGSAEVIRVLHTGELDMNDVSYTTCKNPNPDWQLRVGKLHIDAQQREGSATNARIEVKGVPVFYTPYISFPVGNERKSGLLFPSGGDSSRSGTSVALPYYWNIAPNYDATIKPTWYSARGWDMGSEFRFLTEEHQGTIRSHYLPSDRITQTDRSLFAVDTQSDFMQNLRLTTHAANVSDPQYFEDLTDSSQSSTVLVPREALMQWQRDHWSVDAFAQQYQVIDQSIPLAYRPYAMVPRVGIHGYYPDRAFGLTTSLDAELVAFRRNNDNVLDAPSATVPGVPTCRSDANGNLLLDSNGDLLNAPLCQDYNGNRIDVMPELRLPIRGASGYIEPALAWRYTAYQLVDERSSVPFKTAKRSLPIASIDSSIVFERVTGSGTRIQTFEPRVLYMYIPYRNQDALPVFDTSRPDLTLIQLFNTNRYIGADRVGDTNQVAYGFTSRLLSRANGQQYLSATIGQTIRYSTPKVTLPGEVPGAYDRSDVVGELNLTAYRHWSAQAGLQWNPNLRRTERIEFGFQYLPEAGRAISVGYRFRQPRNIINSTNTAQPLEQLHAAFVWPVGSQFSAFGRVVYSLRDQFQNQLGATPSTATNQQKRRATAIEQFAGFEYRACCWNMRLVAGRRLATREGQFDTWYHWQIELKGLSSVGSADAFLTQSIPGYSAARTESPSIP